MGNLRVAAREEPVLVTSAEVCLQKENNFITKILKEMLGVVLIAT
jgi:hypothetical protein